MGQSGQWTEPSVFYTVMWKTSDKETACRKCIKPLSFFLIKKDKEIALLYLVLRDLC